MKTQRDPIKQIARNNQNHSHPSRSRDRRVEPCSRIISGVDGGSSSMTSSGIEPLPSSDKW